MADLISENKPGDIKTLEYIHHNKTAVMFYGAAAMGALTGSANSTQLHNLADYGLKLGLCFQIADDILDVCSTNQEMGKTVGKDAQQGKMTYPALLGLEKSKTLAEQTTAQALSCLAEFGPKADILRYLATAMLHRTK